MADFLPSCEAITRDDTMPDLTIKQYALLNMLSQYDSVDYGELASNCGFQKPVLTRALHVLERCGWLASQPNPIDRRRRLMALTPSGRAFIAKLRMI